MKRNVVLSFIILLILFSCKSKEKIESKNADNEIKNAPEIVILVDKVTFENQLIFEIQNNTDQDIIIYSPAIKNIDIFEDNKWRKVKILYCPCGANCKAPPREMVLSPGKTNKYKWDLVEAWCGMEDNNGIPETVKIPPKKGLYRIKVKYSINSEINVIEKEFNVVE